MFANNDTLKVAGSNPAPRFMKLDQYAPYLGQQVKLFDQTIQSRGAAVPRIGFITSISVRVNTVGVTYFNEGQHGLPLVEAASMIPFVPLGSEPSSGMTIYCTPANDLVPAERVASIPITGTIGILCHNPEQSPKPDRPTRGSRAGDAVPARPTTTPRRTVVGG